MPTVLVVEDRAETRRPMAKLLRQEGYDVITAVDAYSAAASLRNDHPDLMLLDIGIPPMDGLTLLSLLKEDPNVAKPPVVVITGLSDPNLVARAQELGVQDHLIKSHFCAQELLDVVRKHVGPGAPASPPQAMQ